MKQSQGLSTKIMHSDRLLNPEHGAIHKPIHTSLAYGHEISEDLAHIFQGKKEGYSYNRMSNPTVAALEQKICLMEEGVSTLVFSTGMSAISSMLISLLKSDDHVVASKFLFGNTRGVFEKLREMGIDVSFVDATSKNAVEAAIKDSTRLVYVETIANPVTQVADLYGIGELCATKEIPFIVDNTIGTPCLFKPKNAGASLIIHSLSKYICGHANALGGCVVDTGLFDWSTFPNIHEIYKEDFPVDKWVTAQMMARGRRDFGGALAPEAAHHISVGSETLQLRMNKNCQNAIAIAEFLESHGNVKKVYYPGLKSHPQHERAKQLFKVGFGGLLSFELDPDIDCFKFLDRLKIVVTSVNIGDNRTLAVPVAHTIFYEMGSQRRQSAGISDSMIRLSIGIEDTEDLIDDFAIALQ